MATVGEVQDMGWLAWRDPRAWMEEMRGERWNALVQRENDAFSAAVSSVAGKEELEAAISSFEAAVQEGEPARSWFVPISAGTTLRVLPHGSSGITWFWEEGGDEAGEGSAKGVDAGDLAIGVGGLFAYTRDFGKGAESYELIVQRGRRRLWSSRGTGGLGYGPSVAIVGGYVVVQEASRPLHYSRIVAIDLTEKGRKALTLYEEAPNSTWMLTLIKGEGECLFFVAEQAGRQRLYTLERGDRGRPLRVRQLCPEGVCFYPLGRLRAAPVGTDPCYFVRRRRMDAPWEIAGGGVTQWKFSSVLRSRGIETAIGELGLVVFKAHGERILWHAGRGEVQRIIGEVAVNPWARWAGKVGANDIVVTAPGATPVRAIVHPRSSGEALRLEYPVSEYGGRRTHGFARSSDGARVRWLLIQNANRPAGERPVGLLVAAYGAYGLATVLDTGRWKPYLERGWAVGLALVRGGGDDNELWAEAGRREGKLRGVEDLEACIRAMQAATGVAAAGTIVFGRSAGGYLVGATVVRHPQGKLFGTAYVEVPYVDVLRTAGNPALPLTEFEYLEFGDPARRVADFEFLLRHAPISGLGPEGAPGVRVLCRTALNDRQVYAYESAKWVDALRGKGGQQAPKLLAIQEGAGHFVRGAMQSIQRAEDMLILLKNPQV